MTDAELAAWVAESRARQGLPPFVEDCQALRKLASLVAGALSERGAPGHSTGSPDAIHTYALDAPDQENERTHSSPTPHKARTT